MHTHIFEPSDPRLGRHVQRDPRSLAYPHGVLPKSALTAADLADQMRALPAANGV